MTQQGAKDPEAIHKICAQMISVMADAVLLVDPDGIITRTNQATLSLAGYLEAELLGEPIGKILCCTEDRAAGTTKDGVMQPGLLKEILASTESFLFPQQGPPIPISVRSSSVVEDDGQVSGVVLVARDLRPTKRLIAEAAMAEAEHAKRQELQQAYDELKQLQVQLIHSEKMASIGQIAAGVAHEINNPISGIMVYLHMLVRDLEKGELDRAQALHFLTDSQQELTRCSRIIKSLLDFARQSKPKLVEVAIQEVLEDVFSMLEYQAKLQDIDVVKDLPGNLPSVEADSDQMKQVFLNLILNAVQAMPSGGMLGIRGYPVEGDAEGGKEPRRLRVDVEDTGSGIADEHLGRLFTPFFTTKEKGEGVGLGLAVAYGIVKRHGGDIRVTSRLGEGAMFSVYLRTKQDEEEA